MSECKPKDEIQTMIDRANSVNTLIDKIKLLTIVKQRSKNTIDALTHENEDKDKLIKHLGDVCVKQLDVIEKQIAENEALRENIHCGCDLCLAHNNMVCPKTISSTAEDITNYTTSSTTIKGGSR